MTGPQPGSLTRLGDAECDRFEAAWRAGPRPRLEDHLAAVPEAERPALLRELLLLEIDYRRLAGEQPAAEDYLARFPDLDRAWLAAVLSETAPPVPRPSLGAQGPASAETVNAPPTLSPLRFQPALAAGAGPAPVTDLTPVLRKRLRFISLVAFAIYAYFAVVGGLNMARATFDQFLKYWFYCPPYLLALAITTWLAVVLWQRRSLSLRQLRGMELTLFGLILVGPAWELFCDLFFSPPFPAAARWVRTPEENIYFLSLHSAYTSLPFFILIVSYATLIPSSWRRCTAVVGGMALTPLAISAAAGVAMLVGGRPAADEHQAASPQILGAAAGDQPVAVGPQIMSTAASVAPVGSPATFFLHYVLPMGIFLGIAVAIAAYGTHRVELLRQEAAQARRLGQYQLVRHLGSGGMGEVYLAEHLLLKQPCAIKLIRPERAGDPATLRRFEREVQATARLKHWNTVQIYDYGHAADGTFYYVMEYLSGLTLEQLVKRHGPLPPGRAVHLLRQVCLALREAHALGLVHRDIKPANVMVCERGGEHDVVKLLDFGLVKTVGLSREETLTQEGAITGTPAYMSPEQAAGLDHLDCRTDIYSLGAVAYFLLTGYPPFPRDTAIQAIVAHLHDPVRPPAELRPDVPEDLQTVVLRCLEKDPARRFADVSSLHQALTSCGCAGR